MSDDPPLVSGRAVAVVAAVIRRGRQLLITRRRAGAHLGGFWEFPGGKVEPGESPHAALMREIREELDVTISVGPPLLSSRHEYPDRTVEIDFFDCRITGGTPRPAGVAEIAWVTASELGSFRFPEANRDIIGKLMSH